MNNLVKSLSNFARSYLRTTAERCYSTQLQRTNNCPSGYSGSILNTFRQRVFDTFQAMQQIRHKMTLQQIHKRGGLVTKKKYKKNPLGEGRPYAKGVVIKTLIKKPKKPNSANRKCVLVRLSTGKEMTAYIPGEGHNLQEHNIVLCRPGRLKDVPGVKIRCIRGKYDLPHVIKKQQ